MSLYTVLSIGLAIASSVRSDNSILELTKEVCFGKNTFIPRRNMVKPVNLEHFFFL